MNKVITINLNGVAYQLEEGGYDALRAYLDSAARPLEGNPDREEIITDIEQAIADKFRALLRAHKTVVNAKEVAAVLAEMGPVEDDSASAASADDTTGTARATAAHGTTNVESDGVRRLYRIYPEGAMLSGVCNGLGAYFGLDPTLFRIGFVLLAMLWGTGVLAYVIMVLLIPHAKTSAEKAAATGAAATAQEFIKRAKAGYYEGMKSFRDKHARRAWKRKFKQETRSWKFGFQKHMHEQSQQWEQQWQGPWVTPPIAGPVFIAPLLSLLLLVLVICMFYAIYSLVTAHAVFGVVLPATIPLWVGLIIIIVLYQIVSWPIKVLRYSCYHPGTYGGCGPGPFGGLFGSLIGLFFLGFGIWMLDRHVPEFHEWLVQLPDLLHRLVDTVQGWFVQKGNP